MPAWLRLGPGLGSKSQMGVCSGLEAAIGAGTGAGTGIATELKIGVGLGLAPGISTGDRARAYISAQWS